MRSGLLAQLLPACALLGLLSCTKPDGAPTNQRTEKFAQLPDWNGIWVAEGMDTDVSGYPVENGPGWNMQLLGRNAPWNAATAEKLKATLPAMLAADATRRATGWGYPAMMDGPPPMQFLITPEETLLVNMYRDVRHIYTDGRHHPAAQDLWPTPWGDSVGHWEAGTLQIDTVAVKRPSMSAFLAPMLTDQGSLSGTAAQDRARSHRDATDDRGSGNAREALDHQRGLQARNDHRSPDSRHL